MPILVDSAYAESTEEIASKIQEIEKRLNLIQEKSENFKDSEIGKQAFQFRITGEMISELQGESVQSIIKSDSTLKGKVNDLVSKYGSSIKEYNKKVSQFEKNSDVSLDKKKSIKLLKQNQIDVEQKIVKVEQKQKTKELVKSELQRIKADEKFQKVHRDIYIENDKDRGINPDDTLLIALNNVVEKEDFSLVSAGMDKMIKQYRDVEVRAQLQQYKTLVMDAMKELEEVNNQNTQVLALTSGDVEIDKNGEGFGEENEIFNPEIIANQLKQQIKTAVSSTKVLADKISEEHKSQYEAAYKVAKIIDDDKPSTSTTSTTTEEEEEEEESGPKYNTKGVLKALAKLAKANEKAQAAVEKVNQAKEKASEAQEALENAQAALEGIDPDSKEYKKALKAVNKAQKNLDKAESKVSKAESKAEKATEQITVAEQKVTDADQKAHEQAVKKAQKAADKAAKLAEAAQKASDKADSKQQKADELSAKADELKQAAEGSDPDSKDAKKAQKAENKANKAAEAAEKAQEKADVKEQKANDAQSAADDAASKVL